MKMKNDLARYILYRQQLEKLKQKTWALAVLARLLFLLTVWVTRYL